MTATAICRGESFARDIEEALAAFTSDVSYAVCIARAAVAIAAKRHAWQARRDLAAAEAAAHAECRQHQFPCHAVCACGTGDCKFAQGQYATLAVAASGGDRIRPQSLRPDAPPETYGLDEAVTALVAVRVARP